MKPTTLDLLKSVIWLENQGPNELPDDLYMQLRDHVAKSTNASDKGRVYLLGKPIYDLMEFKEPPPESRTPPLTCLCGGNMLWYWRPDSTRGIQCERCGAGGKPMLENGRKQA